MRTLRSAESRFSATFQNAKVLVTGGAGLIGSNLARRLAAFGARVTIVDSLLPEFGGNIHNIRDLPPGWALFPGSSPAEIGKS
jgi:nucleoside-diphosphate-sugar epimerase